ncbi:unnamed protein product, partial [Mesorhabditis belari]|uniref:Hexosyltransferase n=1 Tax=Mesorhabditis belari TaxID=2138241 RepID=A0AAF3EVP0_9BILA
MKNVDYRYLFLASAAVIIYLLYHDYQESQRNVIIPMYSNAYDYPSAFGAPQRVHPMLRQHQPAHSIQLVNANNQPITIVPHPWYQPFRWTILPQNFCQNDMKVVFVVHTAVSNKEKRAAIRDTYANMQWYKKYHIRTLFATGRSMDRNDEQQLEAEAKFHQDIVQADFIDHYRNLTIKGLSWMRFLRDHCPSVQLVVKLDDDLLPNIFGFMEDFEKNKVKTNKTFTCLLYYGNVIRDPGSPWFVSKEAMPEDQWGRYCTGTSFIMSKDLAAEIVAAVEKRLHYISVDDAFFTGPIGREIGANYDFDTYASKYELNDVHTEEKMMARSVYFALYPTVAALRRMFTELEYIYKVVTDAPDHFKDYAKVQN